MTRGVTVIGQGARQGGQLLSTGLHSGSEILRRDAGLDVGDLGAGWLDRATGRGRGMGYGYVGADAPGAHDSREGTLGETADEFFAREMGPGDDVDAGWDEDTRGTGGGAAARGGTGGFGSRRAGTGAAAGSGRSTPSSQRNGPAASAAVIGGQGRTLSPPAAAPVPQVPQDEDAWAKLAPQSAARAASVTSKNGTSGRASPATSMSSQSKPASSVATKKKDDDWDDFDDAEW